MKELTEKLFEHLEKEVEKATGVYAVKAPELDPDINEAPELPYIVYRRLNTDYHYTHQGQAGSGEVWFRVSCFAKNQAVALELAEEVVKAADSWPDPVGTFVLDTNDQREPEPEVAHVVVEFKCWYE